MACFHPLSAWQQDDGSIKFKETARTLRHLNLPCGRCIGCRLKKARDWTIRCIHEAQMHHNSVFITLTYKETDWYPSLIVKDWQRFMYRYRRAKGPTRFYMCGEYGEHNLRPHFHALLFGTTLQRDYPVSKLAWGSHELDKLWGKGFASHGDVTPESAGYVARYAVKKITGEKAEAHYTRLDPFTGELINARPEFATMSLKPGIGATWFAKYWKEVYQGRDGIVRPGGQIMPPPRFYDTLLAQTDPDLKTEKDLERYTRSAQFAEDTTPARLAVRETCAKAKQRFLRRDTI